MWWLRKRAGKNTKYFFLPVFRSSRGFTLLEIMVVVVILSIAVTVSLASFGDYAKRQQYLTEVSNIKRAINEQRTRAVSSLKDSEYGISVSSTTMTLFRGMSYDPTDTANTALGLNYSRATSSLMSNGIPTTTVSFAKRTGVASATGTIELYPLLTDDSTSTITIYASGIIE